MAHVHDWSRLDAMTAAEKHAGAVSDPDNPPLTEEDMRRMKRTPRAKIIRRALGLTQEEFAERAKMSYKYYQQIEAGRKSDLRLSTLEKLARAHGIALSRLLNEERRI